MDGGQELLEAGCYYFIAVRKGDIQFRSDKGGGRQRDRIDKQDIGLGSADGPRESKTKS